MTTSLQRAQRRAERWRKWHSWAGLVSALILLNLAITGVLINHTDDLTLDQRHISFAPLLKWYGFKPPGRAIRFYQPNSHLIQLDEAVYLDQLRLFDSVEQVIAVCPVGEMLALINRIETRLITPVGELIETIPLPDTLVTKVERATCATNGPQIEAAGQLFGSDELFADWHPVDWSANIIWSEPELLTRAERTAAYHLYHQRSLTWERLLLDLHSGRLLGITGVVIVDAAAVLLLLQLLSGIYLFWRQGSGEKVADRLRR